MLVAPESQNDLRRHLIERVNQELGQDRNLDEVLRKSVRLPLPVLGDLCVIALSDREEGDQALVEVAHLDPAQQASLRRLVEQNSTALYRTASRAAGAGVTFRWIPRVDPATVTTAIDASRDEPQLARLVELLQVWSLMVVAIQNGGQVLGAMAVARTQGEEPYSGAELASLQLVARRVALAIETARMHATMQEAVRHHSHLEEGLRKWSQVFHVAGWGAAVVDQDLVIDVVNPAFAQLHGYADPDDMQGRPFRQLLLPEREPELEHWGHGAVYESIHQRQDGRSFPALVNVTPLLADTSHESYVVTVQDLTELKRAEDRLRRAQRMEAVGRLAGGVAHEVNNMMTIILGFSDLLSHSPELAAGLQGDVEEIRKAASRAGKITQQLLAFSRQQVLQPSDLQLNTIVEDLILVLRLLLPANVRVEVGLNPMDATVRADRAQIEQVLINLAFNARDAMPQGGTIRITTETRFLSEDAGHRLIGVPFPPGDYALISVIDTGHGMDAQTLAQVFEPFFTTKPMGLGTGLGLATVYGIVKQSGGYVWVESTPGEGTTFTVGLPLAEGPLAASQNGTEAPPRGSSPGGTVLVVEDEDGVRQLAGRILEARGYHVVEARNGAEAVAAMRGSEEAVDLVLTDVVVPDLGTGELARRVREVQDGVPILYMSGYPREDVLQRKLISADQPFLQKPFTGDELADGVERVIRNEDPVAEG
jgi:PAS domain S-box-containing protein